jgi:hypothetical protein
MPPPAWPARIPGSGCRSAACRLPPSASAIPGKGRSRVSGLPLPFLPEGEPGEKQKRSDTDLPIRSPSQKSGPHAAMARPAIFTPLPGYLSIQRSIRQLLLLLSRLRLRSPGCLRLRFGRSPGCLRFRFGSGRPFRGGRFLRCARLRLRLFFLAHFRLLLPARDDCRDWWQALFL